ncbi:MAG: glycosyltransferase [Dysgonamonadaceae bacterium]|jgi:rhamnosyltransferase|nr:glycosyltransferase [Dysgonamonadaceae bacterium]
MKISLIIPTLNAGKGIDRLLRSLNNQTVSLDEIIVIDSQSDDDTEEICRKYEKVIFIKIDRNEFDHGGTRDYAFHKSNGDFVLFLTQDALPIDEHYVEQILLPFQDEAVAMVSGRQIAKKDASEREKLTRNFNYPSHSSTKTKKDIPVLGIKTFFASNVCSAYRKSAYLQVGGFEFPLLTNEDLLIAARFIYKGYKVIYCAEAKVIHSHHFTLKQHFARNFDIGVFMNMNSHVFQNIPTTQEGIKMVKEILSELLKKGRILQAVYYCCENGIKLCGYRLGLRYRRLSRQLVVRCSANKNFWINRFFQDAQ